MQIRVLLVWRGVGLAGGGVLPVRGHSHRGHRMTHRMSAFVLEAQSGNCEGTAEGLKYDRNS